MNKMRSLIETTAQLFDDSDVINGDNQKDALVQALAKIQELENVLTSAMDTSDPVYLEMQELIDRLGDMFMSYL